MTFNTKLTKAAALARLQTLASGLQSLLPNGSFTLASTVYGTAQIVTALQGVITALNALNTAQDAAKAAVANYTTLKTTNAPLFSAVRAALQVMYANAPDKLGVLGIAPRKARAPLTTEKASAAVAKAKATRVARGTVGPKKRLTVKGTVTGVQIIPISAPVAAPAMTAPAATAPAAEATQLAPVTSSATPPVPAK